MILSENYRNAMDKITMSDELRNRIMAAAKEKMQPQSKQKYSRSFYVKRISGVAACIAVALVSLSVVKNIPSTRSSVVTNSSATPAAGSASTAPSENKNDFNAGMPAPSQGNGSDPGQSRSTAPKANTPAGSGAGSGAGTGSTAPKANAPSGQSGNSAPKTGSSASSSGGTAQSGNAAAVQQPQSVPSEAQPHQNDAAPVQQEHEQEQDQDQENAAPAENDAPNNYDFSAPTAENNASSADSKAVPELKTEAPPKSFAGSEKTADDTVMSKAAPAAANEKAASPNENNSMSMSSGSGGGSAYMASVYSNDSGAEETKTTEDIRAEVPFTFACPSYLPAGYSETNASFDGTSTVDINYGSAENSIRYTVSKDSAGSADPGSYFDGYAQKIVSTGKYNNVTLYSQDGEYYGAVWKNSGMTYMISCTDLKEGEIEKIIAGVK